MGIKHFFLWFSTEFPQYISRFNKKSPPKEVSIDTLMLDLNGVIHNSAQKIYKYGNHSQPKSILRPKRNEIRDSPILQKACYVDICSTVEEMIEFVKPKKRLILAIDGVAPLSKQNQQRQRRYRGAMEHPDAYANKEEFDPNCITPGTRFMDNLSRYIDWFLRKKINDRVFDKELEIIFSNEKVAGEGEHKLVNFIRKFGTEEETYCINALDADLFMLSLATQKKNFYLLREDTYTQDIDYMYVNIGSGFREDLIKNLLSWSEENDEKRLICDFILICFLCGNDFLPNIPSINLIEKGLSTIIDIYKREKKYLTKFDEVNNVMFDKENFGIFLQNLANCEEGFLNEKIKNKLLYIPDTILERNVNEEDNSINFENYRKDYYETKHMNEVEKVCEDYLDGCQWVLTYYVNGISDWEFIYKHHYSPFATELCKYVKDYNFKKSRKTFPLTPFEQLLCVLPPSNSSFLPSPLNTLYTTELKQFCPTEFKINYEGKKKKWEGVVELPVVDFEYVKKIYREKEKLIDKKEIHRNIRGKNFRYSFDDSEFCQEFKSFYGDIRNCRVMTEAIDF